MKRFRVSFVLLGIACVLVFFAVFQGYAGPSGGSVSYLPVDPPREGRIISVYKISDNDFYIVYADAVWHYENPSWTLLTFDQQIQHLKRIGGFGSVLYAVGEWGQVFKIEGNSGQFWNSYNELVSDTTLRDVHVTPGGNVIAVGHRDTMMGVKPVIFENDGTSDDWSKTFEGSTGGDNYFSSIDGNSSGQFVAAGKEGMGASAVYSPDSGRNWNPVDLSQISRVIPPFAAVSYDPLTSTFLMGGESTTVQYFPSYTPTDSNVKYLPDAGKINAQYKNFAVGQGGGPMATGAVYIHNCPEGWSADVSPNSGILYGVSGSSDIIVVGDEGTILVRKTGAGPGPAPASIPTLSQWGTIILALVMIIAGMAVLRRRNTEL